MKSYSIYIVYIEVDLVSTSADKETIMSYQERQSIISLLSTLIITAAYSAYMLQRYPAADAYSPEVFRFWGTYFLVLIPVTIVAKIIITILFSILNTIATREAQPDLMDERDKLIELKCARISLYTFSLGVVLAVGSLVFDQVPAVMFALLIGAGILSEIVFDVTQFVLYRRGF